MPRLVMPNALWVSYSMPAMACRFMATNYLGPTDTKLAREGATRFSVCRGRDLRQHEDKAREQPDRQGA